MYFDQIWLVFHLFWSCAHVCIYYLWCKIIHSKKSLLWCLPKEGDCMVSLWNLQNWHKGGCSGLNLATDLFVVKMLCKILNFSHLSFVSVVLFFKNLKLFSHWSSDICVCSVYVIFYIPYFGYQAQAWDGI